MYGLDGMPLNNSPIHLKFENISVKIGEKYILRDIFGDVKPVEVLALMGPSGAGKTTLMNVLHGRMRMNGMQMVDGCILINNKFSTKRIRRKIGYVVQEDIFLTHLSVKQTLEFAGDLLIPDTLSKERKMSMVSKVIDELHLNKCLSTPVGGGMFTTGCSGGEKKRCSIAIEMIRNPAMLILDEPTTGLDAATATSLVKSISDFAIKQNKSVIISIHQPSSHVFHMFDKLLPLSNGKVAYYGRTNRVLDLFSNLGLPCYPNWNPADYILERLSEGPEIEEKIVLGYANDAESKKTLYFTPINDSKNNAEAIDNDSIDIDFEKKKSKEHLMMIGITSTENTCANVAYTNDEDMNDEKVQPNGHPNISDIEVEMKSTEMRKNDPKWPTGIKTQIAALFRRSFIQRRKIMFDRVKFIEYAACIILASVVWFNSPYDENSIHDRNGVIFWLIVYISFINLMLAITSFITEQPAIEKERASGMYGLSAYFIAKNFSEIPLVLVMPFLHYPIVYWASGLNRSPVFLIGLFAMITDALISQSVGYCIAALLKHPGKSVPVGVTYVTACLMFGGFYNQNIPKWLDSWAPYITHTALLFNIGQRMEFEYASTKFNCANVDSRFDQCKRNSTTVVSGKEILAKYSNMDLTIVDSFLVLWSIIIFLRGLFYVLLRRMRH